MQFPIETQINSAVKNGDIKLLVELLDSFNNDRLNADYLHESFLNACGDGSVEIVELLLERFNATLYANRGLDWAAKNGHIRIVELLVEKGADPYYGLFGAASYGHLNIIELLIEKGADPFAGIDGALRVACIEGETEVVAFLLSIYARQRDTFKERVKSFFGHKSAITSRLNGAMGIAIINHQLEVVKLLVECGVNIHFRNERALQTAVSEGELDIVQYLIEKGACMHAGKPSAYNLAMSSGHYEVASFLKTLNLKNAQLQDDAPHDRSGSVKRRAL